MINRHHKIYFYAAMLMVLIILSCIFIVYQRTTTKTHTTASTIIKPLSNSICNKILHSKKTITWDINTSNPGKLLDFNKIFKKLNIAIKTTFHQDLAEINSDHLAVTIHKASQFNQNNVIIEDSSLSVDGANLGVNVKWLHHKIPSLIGKKATLTALVAHRFKNTVFVYKGSLEGTLVQPKGPKIKGLELNRYFQPKGSHKTLAQLPFDRYNPRLKAIKALKEKKYLICTKPLVAWSGSWQNESN